MTTHNVSDAAARSGVSAKMVRHYEEIGLIPKAQRTDSGYRIYTDADVHTLRFIRQARDVGFSIRQIGELLSLWQDRGRRSSDVKKLALAHIRELEAKLAETAAMKASLEQLVHCCAANDRPDCPILDGIADARLGATRPPMSPRRVVPPKTSRRRDA